MKYIRNPTNYLIKQYDTELHSRWLLIIISVAVDTALSSPVEVPTMSQICYMSGRHGASVTHGPGKEHMDQLKRLVWGPGEHPGGLLPPQEYQLDLEAYMTVITGCIRPELVYIRLLQMSHVSNMFYVKYTWCIWYTWTWLEAHRWSCYWGLYNGVSVYGLYWSILG